MFGSDPRSHAPTTGWDRRAGFATEGEAARARAREDREACEVIGVRSRALRFGSVDYERRGDEASVRAAVLAAVGGADAALLPGHPLTHPDHAWLVRAILAGSLPWRWVGLYVEQPYTWRARTTSSVPDWLETSVGSAPFQPIAVRLRDRLAKWRAVRRYESQLPLLALSAHGGLPVLELLWAEARAGGERVAWLAP